jgi:2-polyprenyl-6-methoxyphenol hydroxylase-like FAD-dependent oxidoreductase
MGILISGAGPAGLTTAHWLRRYGFTPTINERAPAVVTGRYKDATFAARRSMRCAGWMRSKLLTLRARRYRRPSSSTGIAT